MLIARVSDMTTTVESHHTLPFAPAVPICKLPQSLSQRKADDSAEISGYKLKFGEEKCPSSVEFACIRAQLVDYDDAHIAAIATDKHLSHAENLMRLAMIS